MSADTNLLFNCIGKPSTSNNMPIGKTHDLDHH